MQHRNKEFISHPMINRTMLRIRIVQMMFAYLKSDADSARAVEKQLLQSFQDTYDLYFQLLLLPVEITRFAQQRIESAKSKYLPTEAEKHPNMRFVENTFVAQLEKNVDLNFRMKENKRISWSDNVEVISELYSLIQESDIYKEYMSKPVVTYDDDKQMWRKLLTDVIIPNEGFCDALESMSIYWIGDLDAVASFVVKTIRRFQAENEHTQELLPMFSDEEDREFAMTVLRDAIKHLDEYRKMIDEHANNWDVERLAYMDIVIMLVAVAEIMSVPTIPVSVTLNEYMEIAKEYSTEKSASFINGVLDNIVKKLKSEKKLIKVALV